jgi:hypothetical protein
MQTNAATTAGTYYVNAVADVSVDYQNPNDNVTCYLSTFYLGDQRDGVYGVASTFGSLSITDYFYLEVGDSVDMFCGSGTGDSEDYFQGGAITALLVSSAEILEDTKRNFMRDKRQSAAH